MREGNFFFFLPFCYKFSLEIYSDSVHHYFNYQIYHIRTMGGLSTYRRPPRISFYKWPEVNIGRKSNTNVYNVGGQIQWACGAWVTHSFFFALYTDVRMTGFYFFSLTVIFESVFTFVLGSRACLVTPIRRYNSRYFFLVRDYRSYSRPV